MNLTDAVQDDFRAAVVEFDGSLDFYGAAFEAADVADIFQVRREDDDGKGASHLIFTEVNEVNAFDADAHAMHGPGYAFGFADMLAGLVDGDAVGGGKSRGDKEEE